MRWWYTVIRDVWYLEPSSAVHIIRFKVNPETTRPSRECDGPLVRLTCLIRGDGGRRPCENNIQINYPFTNVRPTSSQMSKSTHSSSSWLKHLHTRPRTAERFQEPRLESCVCAEGLWSSCTPRWLGSFQDSWETRCIRWTRRFHRRTHDLNKQQTNTFREFICTSGGLKRKHSF